MQRRNQQIAGQTFGLARNMPVAQGYGGAPEGACIADGTSDQGKIAVIYDKGDPPPKITIKGMAGQVQTVMADGVAVAIVACAQGPSLSTKDVLLVERYV